MVKLLVYLEGIEIFLYYDRNEVVNNGKNYLYKIMCLFKSNWFTFTFTDSQYNHDNGKMLGENDLKEALSCYLNDAMAGALDYPEFLEEFGYDGGRESYNIHTACKEVYNELMLVTDLDEINNIRSAISG